jgi:hypothetical protein
MFVLCCGILRTKRLVTKSLCPKMIPVRTTCKVTIAFLFTLLITKTKFLVHFNIITYKPSGHTYWWWATLDGQTPFTADSKHGRELGRIGG